MAKKILNPWVIFTLHSRMEANPEEECGIRDNHAPLSLFCLHTHQLKEQPFPAHHLYQGKYHTFLQEVVFSGCFCLVSIGKMTQYLFME